MHHVIVNLSKLLDSLQDFFAVISAEPQENPSEAFEAAWRGKRAELHAVFAEIFPLHIAPLNSCEGPQMLCLGPFGGQPVSDGKKELRQRREQKPSGDQREHNIGKSGGGKPNGGQTQHCRRNSLGRLHGGKVYGPLKDGVSSSSGA
jgi:hypothetical protein